MTKAPSIALFMHDFSGGGVERMRLALASALVARGLCVSLVVVRVEGPLRRQVPPGIAVHNLRCSRTIQACAKLRRYILDAEPDFLISSLDHNNVVALCAGIWARARTRVIICQHNALSQELHEGLKYRAIPVLYWLLQSSAAAIVAVSDGVGRDLVRTARLPPDRVTVISNPVVPDTDDPPHCPSPPPHKWFTDPIPVFVLVGRLVAQKDPTTLIRAFTARLAWGPARLIVLGDGPLRPSMERLVTAAGIGAQVHFAGYVDNPRDWMACAAALVLTSRHEGFGNVVVEALACGTPVIATDCPHGPAEILGDGVYGELVAVGDAAAIACAMSRDLRASFPAALLRARSRDYTVSRCAECHVALFARLGWRRRYRAFGLDLCRETAASIAARLLEDPSDTGVRLIVTPNLNHVRLLSRRAFSQACADADIVCPDGWPVALYASLRHLAPIRRATGCDIFHHLVRRVDAGCHRVLVVTESAGTDAALRAWLAARQWSQSWGSVCAPQNLGADHRAQRLLLADIKAFAPAILVMTLGAPTSEEFVHAHRHELPPCWAICVGQAVRVELGLVERAPRPLRRVGLEWAWRWSREPRRLGLRYLCDVLWFPLAIISDVVWQGWGRRAVPPVRTGHIGNTSDRAHR
jgi:exopolysaccharide biosynthesis WecB/TagA/CpsF family protein